MNKVLKILGIIAASITSLVYFAILLVFTFTISFSSVINKDDLKGYVQNIDFTALPIGTIVSDQEANGLTDEETVKDFLIDILENSGLTTLESETIVNSEDAKAIINNYIYDMFDYSFYGNDALPELSSEDIITAITDAGVELTNKENDEITSLVTSLNDGIYANLNIDEIKTDAIPAADVFQSVVTILNGVWFKVAFASIFVFTFFLVALFTWSLYKPFIWLGVPTIIVGAIIALVGSTTYVMNGITITDLGSYQAILNDFVSPFFDKLLIYGFAVLITGIIMVVIYSIIDKHVSKKEEPKLDDEKTEE